MFSQKSRKKWILLFSVIAIIGATLGFLRGPRTAIAGQNATAGLNVFVDSSDERIQGRSVMVSILRNGALLHQTEVGVGGRIGLGGNLYRESYPAGLYDVRVEGEGIVTLVKRGINLTAGNGTEIRMSLQAGNGVHIIEYATGALSREQVAASLRSLEARIAKLEAK